MSFHLNDTLIEKGGVWRCCLATVALEYQGKEVSLGDKSKCQHCGEEFTLVMVVPPMTTCYRTTDKPIWQPNWQLKPRS